MLNVQWAIIDPRRARIRTAGRIRALTIPRFGRHSAFASSVVTHSISLSRVAFTFVLFAGFAELEGYHVPPRTLVAIPAAVTRFTRGGSASLLRTFMVSAHCLSKTIRETTLQI